MRALMTAKVLGIMGAVAAVACAILVATPDHAQARRGHLVRVCVKWAPSAPGTFAGPCIQYSYRWSRGPSTIYLH
jgi:hypothetical protein